MFGKFFDEITKPSLDVARVTGRLVAKQAQQSFADATKQAGDEIARQLTLAVQVEVKKAEKRGQDRAATALFSAVYGDDTDFSGTGG